MLNSLKKPASGGAKKPLSAAEKAEAVAAAVAAAQAAKKGSTAAAASKTTGNSKASSSSASTEAAKTNGKDTKESKDKKDNKEETENGENGADDKEDEEEEKEADEKGQNAEAKAAMKNMTGYQQETEREGVDSAKLEKAMSLITDVVKKQKADKAASQLEAAKITLSKQDVELVMTEMDITKASAEKHLKEHGGDVIKTLEALVLA